MFTGTDSRVSVQRRYPMLPQNQDSRVFGSEGQTVMVWLKGVANLLQGTVLSEGRGHIAT